MAKQLFTTLTDSAVRDASYISDAVDCDGFYSVYDTMVENIDEYIDAYSNQIKIAFCIDIFDII